jgi:hypothetical protein
MVQNQISLDPGSGSVQSNNCAMLQANHARETKGREVASGADQCYPTGPHTSDAREEAREPHSI